MSLLIWLKILIESYLFRIIKYNATVCWCVANIVGWPSKANEKSDYHEVFSYDDIISIN